MDSKELQELVAHIRSALQSPSIGLTMAELNTYRAKLDSDAYKAALAVESFFELKRKQS